VDQLHPPLGDGQPGHKLNQRLAQAGKPPVLIRPVDDALEDEDVLQMVDAGILPITVSKDLGAAFWAKVYDRLSLRSDLVLRDDGSLPGRFASIRPSCCTRSTRSCGGTARERSSAT
jgi:membrane-bound lytic murein transglycosylase MltF